MSINPWDTTTATFVESNVSRRQALRRVEEPEFFADTLPAALGYQYMPMFNAVKNAVKYGTEVQEGYNPLNDVDGYEEYKHHLMNAVSEDHMIDLKFQLDENKRRRQVLADSSFWANVGVGVFDPINLVALPFGGAAATAGRQFLRTGAGVGTVQVGLEGFRAPFDPLATKEEVAINIGSAFVIGGAIGTLATIPARRQVAAIRKTEEDVIEYTKALEGFTAEDVAVIGQRQSRKLGKASKEELDSIEVQTPKDLEGIAKGLDDAKRNFSLGKIDVEEYDSAVAGLTNRKIQLEDRLTDVKYEQRMRRAEEIQGIEKIAEDGFNLPSNAFTDSWLYKGVTTGMKRILQGDVPQTVKATAVKLAGDSGVLLRLNQYGMATPKSVYQYSQTRNGEWLKVYTGMLQQFGEHTKKGYLQVGDVNLSNIDGSFSAYLKEVNRKYINGIEPTTTAEKESIQALKNFYKTWEDRLKEVGLLGDVKRLQRGILQKERDLMDIQDKIDELEASFNTGSKQGGTKRQFEYLQRLRERFDKKEQALREDEMSLQFAKDTTVTPVGEELMFPRYWNRDAIRENRQQFEKILADHFEEHNVIYVPNESVNRPLSNFIDMSNEDLIKRLGKDFNVNKVVDGLEAVDKIKEHHPSGALGMHMYFDNEAGIVYIDKAGAYRKYQRFQKALADKKAAYENNDKFGAKSDFNDEVYHHNAFMLNNSDAFKSYRDYADFVLLHEFHHGTLKRRYKEDNVSYEMRVNEAALEFMKQQHLAMRKTSPRFIRQELDNSRPAVEARAKEAVDNILGMADPANDMNAFYGAGRSKHFRHRSLDIPNAKVLDYIQNDPLAVMRAYTQRVAPQYEFAKMFNGKSIDEVLDDVETDMFSAGKSMNQINATRKDILHLYDRVVGTVLREPHSWDQRVATVLRDFAQLNYLGSAGFSTLPDFAKIMMEHELKDVFKSLFATLTDGRVRMSAMEGKLAGEILEIIQGDAHMRLVDDVTNNPFNEGTYNKYMSKLKWGFYQANLLAPMTNIMKKMDAIVRGHSLIQMSMRLAGSGKKPTKFEIEYLARYGIDTAKAKRIRELVDDGIIEQTEGGLYLPSTENWPKQYDDLKLEFRSSLNSGIMNTILMGTPADKPNIVDGVVYVPYKIARQFGGKEDPRYKGYTRIENGLLGLPFQFYSYTLAAVNKITASYATGQARNRTVALAASMGLAYMGLELKNPDFVMDKMPIEDKIARSFDMSGIAALYSDSFYTAMSTSMALGGPDISMGLLQPKFPQEKNIGDAAVGLLGAGPSIGLDIGRGVNELIEGNYGEGAKQIMRSMPLARLWIWKDFMNEASNSFTARRY